MKIHEYQGKDIFRKFGIPVPEGKPCFDPAQASEIAKSLGGDVWVVKAQIHAGGRGKGGGVKVANSLEEVQAHAESIFGMQLITHQTGPGGQKVNRLLIETGAKIKNELYLGLVIDRTAQQLVLMASAEGGVEIEEVASREPEKIKKIWADPKTGFDASEARKVAGEIGLPAGTHDQFVEFTDKLYDVFIKTDAALCEINPLVVLEDDSLIALDAKLNFDSNALYRQADILGLRDEAEEDQAELEAAKYDLSYISLDGDIGCMVNGAGLAMATMDIIKLCGGNPANFLDVGGGATKEKVQVAFELMLRNPHLKAILINIFGGIMRCDVIAEGVVAAAKETSLNLPLVVRLEGTNVDLGKKILAESNLPIIAATSMADAAQKIVAAVNGK